MDEQKRNAPRVDAEEILDGIRQWVEIETPTHDGEAVNKLADVVEESMRALGALVERTPGRDGFGDILKTRTPGGTHFYNSIDGVRWDFTISQFDRPVPFEDLPSSRDEAMADTSPEQYAALLGRVERMRG